MTTTSGQPLVAGHFESPPFDSEILSGSYTSVTYWLNDGKVETEERVVKAGDLVHYPLHEYHIVKNVLPGTRTRMTCGPATVGNTWGYLDIVSGKEYPATQDPTFMGRMLALNPWRNR